MSAYSDSSNPLNNRSFITQPPVTSFMTPPRVTSRDRQHSALFGRVDPNPPSRTPNIHSVPESSYAEVEVIPSPASPAQELEDTPSAPTRTCLVPQTQPHSPC